MTKSIIDYQALLRKEPHRVEEVFLIATQSAIELQSADSVALFDLVLATKPEYFQAWGNRGNALDDLKRCDEAMDSWAQALKIKSDYVPALVNRGFALHDADQYEEALIDFRHVLELEHDHARVLQQIGITYYNRGVVLQNQGRYAEACARYEQVPATATHYPITRFNRSQCLLAMGQFEEGWKEHEWRWKTDQHKGSWLGFSQPVWRGESLISKTILLWCEQGYGDSFQFSRYVPIVLGLGAKVFLLVRDASSIKFFNASFAGLNVGIIFNWTQAEPFDFHCPLMSLPIACGTDSVGKIPANTPYLFTDSKQSQAGHNRLAKNFGIENRRIGLVWASGYRPDSPYWHGMNQRSMHLRELAPLEALTRSGGMLIFSLQREEPAKQVKALEDEGWRGPKIIDSSSDLNDWADTAAFIANLDLVITSCTGLAHLAAGMGKPTWILLHKSACWRWLEDRDDSPWYPSVRLFRQTKADDWSDVVKRVVEALIGLAEEANNRATQ